MFIVICELLHCHLIFFAKALVSGYRCVFEQTNSNSPFGKRTDAAAKQHTPLTSNALSNTIFFTSNGLPKVNVNEFNLSDFLGLLWFVSWISLNFFLDLVEFVSFDFDLIS